MASTSSQTLTAQSPANASTPQRQISQKQPAVSNASPAPSSPGTWRHPRLPEISRRKLATTFSEKHARSIAYNLTALVGLWVIDIILRQTSIPKMLPSHLHTYAGYGYMTCQLILCVNILIYLLPLLRKPDDFSDIPLTPSQRKLLGLPNKATQQWSESAINSPPRYTRTSSFSGSISSINAVSGSPRSGRASPVVPSSPVALSPLRQKLFAGSNNSRTSFGSFGSPSPVKSAAIGARGFSPERVQSSPSATASRSSIGLNNKWLYEKGRRESNQSWHS